MKLSIPLASALLVVSVSGCAAQGDRRVAAQPAPLRSAGTATTDDQYMAQMQGRMKQMQQQMDRIRQTQDPTERQQLLQEHMRTMSESMGMMRGMGGGIMMGMMGDQHMDGRGMSGMDPKQGQEMMERRIDIMQMMMEQMMQHQQMMQSMPPAR